MDKNVKHAVAVLAHDDIDSLIRLINSFDDDFDFYIHVDSKWADFNEDRLRTGIDRSRSVHLYSWKHVKWGSIDIVKTQIRLVSEALSEKRYDYVHLMSGHDVLLCRCDKLKEYFKTHNGKEFMQFHQLPFSGWEQGSYARLIRFGLYDLLDYNKEKNRNIIEAFIRFQRKFGIKRNIPTQYPRLYGGSNWMSLTAGCWQYILGSYKKSFLRRLRFTFASDEVFFHTIVMNSPFADNVTGDNLRFIRWSDSGAVKTLTKYDWWHICKSHALFARKVRSGISDELTEWIEEGRRMSGSRELTTADDQDVMRHMDYGTGRILKKLVSSLSINSSLEFFCKNGIYVRYLRDMGVNAHGLDTDLDTPVITQRLFPSGFHCLTAPLYEPFSVSFKVDLALVLTHWITDDRNVNKVFIDNLASVSKKYVLMKVEDICNLDSLMEQHGFVRNDTVAQILCDGMEAVGKWLFYEKRIRHSSSE